MSGFSLNWGNRRGIVEHRRVDENFGRLELGVKVWVTAPAANTDGGMRSAECPLAFFFLNFPCA